jgi:hypothetical protein
MIRIIDAGRHPARGFVQGSHQAQETNGHLSIPYPDGSGQDVQAGDPGSRTLRSSLRKMNRNNETRLQSGDAKK